MVMDSYDYNDFLRDNEDDFDSYMEEEREQRAVRDTMMEVSFDDVKELWAEIASYIIYANYPELKELALQFGKVTGYAPIIPETLRDLDKVTFSIYHEEI
jgi:hypothetical protein